METSMSIQGVGNDVQRCEWKQRVANRPSIQRWRCLPRTLLGTTSTEALVSIAGGANVPLWQV
eukprot:1153988-Lingulodinium_polyedra.AAC.1